MRRISLIFILVWLAPLFQSQGPGEPPEPTPSMLQFQDRLAPPPTVYPPTQADQGAQVYYQVCMACHGDRGQGLSDEWRGVLDPADQNCWQSRCHASNYPPGGFVFPKIVPAVVSPGMVARFETALDLHDFLRARMPYQAPGSLDEEEYWQLTAFLLRANGIDPGPPPLDSQRASLILLRASLMPAAAAPQPQPNFWRLALALLALAILLLAVWMGVQKSRAHP